VSRQARQPWWTAVVVSGCLALALPFLGFGIKTACTTELRGAGSCDVVDTGAALGLGLLGAVMLAALAGLVRSGRPVLARATLATAVTAAVISLGVMESWRL
jgi:hypothetical protein